MKGSKGYTKVAHESSLGSSMKATTALFQKEFSFLDWKYMLDPKNGEFVCDVGITLHPLSDDPLVGLWNLEALEASFGAAGFLTGNLHCLNTFAKYGGLQAEQSRTRMERTHVVYKSNYNLGYEVTRKMNNQRDLFQEKEVYTMSPNYIDDCNKVVSLYRGTASKQSYGVRDEIRIGARALGDFESSIDDLVSVN